jgi:hypothetical protein
MRRVATLAVPRRVGEVLIDGMQVDFHDFQFTGVDTFAGKNIFSMGLEVPNDTLGPRPEIAVWATTSVRRDGRLVQVDRYRNPSSGRATPGARAARSATAPFHHRGRD